MNPPLVSVSGKPHSICRCGANLEIGSVLVEYGSLKVTVRLTGDRVLWPGEIEISPDDRPGLDRFIRDSWLRLMAERWRGQEPAR